MKSEKKENYIRQFCNCMKKKYNKKAECRQKHREWVEAFNEGRVGSIQQFREMVKESGVTVSERLHITISGLILLSMLGVGVLFMISGVKDTILLERLYAVSIHASIAFFGCGLTRVIGRISEDEGVTMGYATYGIYIGEMLSIIFLTLLLGDIFTVPFTMMTVVHVAAIAAFFHIGTILRIT